jgi:hypothetical protein
MWTSLRRKRTTSIQPTQILPAIPVETRKTYEFHVPPGMSVATVLRMLGAMEEQGVLPGELKDWSIIPLVSSRHMYHKEHGDKR